MVKNLYTTIGQYPTLYDFLTITPKNITHLNYYLMYANKCVKLKIFQPTLLPLLYSGEMSHHMHDSGESQDLSFCHSVNTTSLSVCLSHISSVCHTINMTSLSV